MEATIMGYIGIIGVIFGVYVGRMEKKVETTIYIPSFLSNLILGIYSGCIGMMENKMETTS